MRRELLGSACVVMVLMLTSSGCWAPLHSRAVPAACLPESFRTPIRTAGEPLNFASLTIAPPEDYIVGPRDVLEVTIPGLFEGAEARPLSVHVMASGEVYLPLVGAVNIGGMNLLRAQETINNAYGKGFLVNPRVSVALAVKSTTTVLVLGKVNAPGVHILPKYENDVGHALAAAGGLSEDAAFEIEVHRRIPLAPSAPLAPPPAPVDESVNYTPPSANAHYWQQSATSTVGQINAVAYINQQRQRRTAPSGYAPGPPIEQQASLFAPPDVQSNGAMVMSLAPNTPELAGEWYDSVDSAPYLDAPQPAPSEAWHPGASTGLAANSAQWIPAGDKQILRIPLRQHGPSGLSESDITLQPGDVVVVPSRRHQVFFVVGRLNPVNSVRFTIGDRERELGVGFVLPREREIDVVTAVAMAGYIDPIDSPTTVTVHRHDENGRPLLIHVDLFKARYSRQETVLVQAGDIIYLNPDAAWWWRRTFDRIVPDMLLLPYSRSLGFR